jgi:hypothetical protein
MEVDLSQSDQALRVATDEFQAAARIGLSEARQARAAVTVAQERKALLQRVAADADQAERQYVVEKRDGRKTYGVYRPVVVEETPQGFVKTYYGTYTKDASKRGYRKAVTPTKIERYDARGTLVQREVFKDYNRGDDGEERPYLFTRETFKNGQLTELYKQKYDNRSGELEYRRTVNYVTGEEKYKDYKRPTPPRNAPIETVYEVQDAAGKTWRSSNPSFIKEKTGVEPSKVKSGTVVLRESGSGKVYYAREQTLNGQKMLVGVGEKSPAMAERVSLTSTQSAVAGSAVSPQRRLLPPDLLAAQIQNVTRGRPMPSLPQGVAAQQEARLSLTQPYSALPPGAVAPFPNLRYLIDQPNELRVSESPESFVSAGGVGLSIEGGAERMSRGDDKLLRARSAFDRGDELQAAKYAAAGVALKFSGGVRNTFQAAINDPAGTAGVAGAYLLAGSLGGPAGVGALFTAQNALEVSTGQEPSAFRIIRDPVTSAGEIAPLAAVGVVAEGAGGVVPSARLNLQSRAYNQRYAGELVTRDVARDLAKPQGTAVSTMVQVRPLLYDFQRAMTTETGGARGTVASRGPVLGDPFMLPGSELQNLPKNYAFRALIEKEATTRPASMNPEGQFGISAPAQTVRVVEWKSGVLSAEELRGAQTPVVRVETGASDLSPLLVRETSGRAVVGFQPIELAGTSEVMVPKQPGGRSGVGPRLRLEQGGSMLEKTGGMLEKKGGMLEYYEKAPTGLPLIIDNVALRRNTGASPKSGGGAAAGGLSVREIVIEKPQPDGTVLRQKVKVIDLADESPETVQEAVQESKTETLQKPKLKEETKQRQERKYAVVQESKTETLQKPKLKEETKQRQERKYAVVQAEKLSVAAATGGRFKVAQKQNSKLSAVLASQMRQEAISGQASAQRAAQKSARQAAQKAAQDTKLAKDKLSLQRLRTDQVSGSGLITGQTSFFRSGTTGKPRPRVPEPLVPETPVVKLPRFRPEEQKERRGVFSVLVKERGKLVPVSIAETAREAFQVAKGLLRSTAKASAQVRDAKGRPVKPTNLGMEFRTSKRDKTVLVERNKFRIDTPGERQEITLKGLRSPKKKRGGLFGRLF